MAKGRGERVRPERLAEQIRMDTAEILQSQLEDPRLPLVTCTRVTVSPDLKNARLYVSVLGTEEDRTRAMKVLEGATGYVRRLLGERLRLRSIPEIRFVFDPSVEFGIRLEELLKDAASPENASGEPPETESEAESEK